MRILPEGSIDFLKTPVVRVFFVLCLLAGVFVAGMVWSSLDNVELRRTYRSAIDQAARLSAKNNDLERENSDLNVQIVRLERKLQIDKIAYEKLTATLNQSSEYISELRGDLDFYQSIISPEDNQPGIKIHEFRLSGTRESGKYRYKLTVVQAINHETVAKGQVELVLRGLRNNTPIEVAFGDLGGGPGKLRFRYFQILEGDISVPADVVPQSVIVRMDAKSGKNTALGDEQNFPWRPGEAGL